MDDTPSLWKTLAEVGGSTCPTGGGSQLQTILLMDCDRSGAGKVFRRPTVSSFVCIPCLRLLLLLAAMG